MSKEITKYTPSEKSLLLFNQVLELIKNGQSVNKACKELKFAQDTFYNIVNNLEIEAEKYVRACELRAYNMAEQSIDIFDNIEKTIIVGGQEQQNTIGLQIAKAKADNLKWYASKLNKALSDKPDNTINIGVSGDVVNVSFDGKEGKQE